MKISTQGVISISCLIVIIAIGGLLYYFKQQPEEEKIKIDYLLQIILPVENHVSSSPVEIINTPSTTEVVQVVNDQSCQSSLDCACGTNIETKSCFIGNKEYVDTTRQCPDFCTGIAGNLRLECTNNICQQTSIKPTSTPAVTGAKIIKFTVPFTSQAPFGEWSDLRQENACEEVATVMAMRWVKGTSLSPTEAKSEIIAISDWEKKYGTYQDTSAEDTVNRIFKTYFKYDRVTVVNNISLKDIISELEQGNLVIVPADGQALGNPFFTPPGPEEHMLVIIGYNYETKRFILNESGTRRGKDYEYDEKVLFEAIRDYPTGNKKPIIGIEKNMIVVRK